MGETLQVPGAVLHHEVRGTGPVLLIIPGGPTDGGMFEGIAELLADRYTVVTYDPRGLSQSTVDDPAAPVSPRLFADDAAALIRSVSGAGGPAYVLGFSSGGLVALELLAHHPDLVRRVVAHEPPATTLLPDAAEHRAEGLRVHETYVARGVWAAMARFTSGAGLDDTATTADPAVDPGPPAAEPVAAAPAGVEAATAPAAAAEPTADPRPAADAERSSGPSAVPEPGMEPAEPAQPATVLEPTPGMADAMAGMRRNLEFFLGNMWLPMLDHTPAVPPFPDRLTIAVGERSTGQLAHRAAEALATHLGVPLVEFPGDHGFHGVEPQFATRLHEVLTTP